MEEKTKEEREDTYNEADLLQLLDEFMGRRAKAGGDTVLLDSKRTISAIGLFLVDVGWVLRLDQTRYIHLPAKVVLPEESTSAEPGSNGPNGARVYEQRRGRRSRRPGKR